jgi:hypothetical protein
MKLSRAQKRALRNINDGTLPIGAQHRTVKKLAAWGYIILTYSLVDKFILYYKPTDKGLAWLGLL